MREYAIATGGLFRSLPPTVGSAVVGAVVLPEGAALVLNDVTAGIPPLRDDPLSIEQVETSLRALAALHSAFVGFPARLTAGLGFSPLGAWLTLFSPTNAERELETEHSSQHDSASRVIAGWDAVARLQPEAGECVYALLRSPAPLVSALRDLPATVVHGNAQAGNFAFIDERVVLLDWSQVLRGPGSLDLAWFLAATSARLPVAFGDAIETYRAERERLGRLPSSGAGWDREIALALAAGALRIGWAKALGALCDNPAVQKRQQDALDFWLSAIVAVTDLIERM
jgi:hypothetical protein